MTDLAPKKSRRKKVLEPAPLPPEALENAQLTLFQTLLTNTPQDFSNAIDFWDGVPRYSLSRQKMNEIRLPGGFLPIRKLDFYFRGHTYSAEIRPARLVTQSAEGIEQTIEYYPSAREELIEHALRKLAVEAQIGFYDNKENRSGLRFSLYQLRKELEKENHSLRYDELIEGLRILALSTIEFTGKNDDSGNFGISPYLRSLVGVTRPEIESNPQARWYVEFHPLVTASIDRLSYRQFNYVRLMHCRSQIARWLLQQIVAKYTAASLTNTFEMRYSTIKRDSALLTGYRFERQAIAAVDAAWKELKDLGALYEVDKTEERGLRQKIEEVIYTLHPSHQFQSEQKAANRRANDALSSLKKGSDTHRKS